MSRILRRTAWVLTAFAAPLPAVAGVDVYGQVTLATDHMFRGVSQTMAGATLQGELGIEHESGWYGYAWASNVQFTEGNTQDDGARIELDVGGGYSMALTERLSATIEATRYLFPGTKAGFDYDYAEWHGTLVLDDAYALTIGYSDNVFGSGADGTFYSLGSDWALTESVGVFLELGHYDLENAYGTSYGYGELALTGVARAVDWRLSYFTTTSEADELFDKSTVGERIVFSVGLLF